MIYGYDISTSIVGLAEFTNDGKFTRNEYIDLRDYETLDDKADVFRVNMIEFVGKNQNHLHFVEERLGNFAAGRSMLQVLMKLAAFNAVCSYIIFENTGEHVKHIHPSSWKATLKREGLVIPKGADKKELTLKYVREHEKDFHVDITKKGKFQPWCYDMADAYCIGRAGYLRECTAKES